MNKQLILLLSFFISTLSFASNGSIGAKSNALGNVSVIHQDIWSVENNPSALGFVNTYGAGVSYKSPFLLNEMATKTLVLSLPIESGTFGAYFNQFGYTEYSENKLGLSYGQQLGENISLGIQLSYLQTQIKENSYKNNSTFSGTVGILSKISDELTLAAKIMNPNRAKRGNYQDERYPTSISLGMAYLYSDKVNLMSEIEKEIEQPTQLKFGIEYQPLDIFYLRAGYASAPSTLAFGFGLLLDDFVLDFSSSFHNVLGFKPELSLSFSIDKKK